MVWLPNTFLTCSLTITQSDISDHQVVVSYQYLELDSGQVRVPLVIVVLLSGTNCLLT